MPTEPSRVSLPDDRTARASRQAGGDRQRRLTERRESGPLTQLFGFAQFDFAGTLPLADGRYLARDGDERRARACSSCETLGRAAAAAAAPAPAAARPTPAPSRRRCRCRGRPRSAPSTPFEDEEEAAALARRGDREARTRSTSLVAEGIALLNRALHAQAVAARRPHVRPS